MCVCVYQGKRESMHACGREIARACVRVACVHLHSSGCTQNCKNTDLPDQSLRPGRLVDLVQEAYGIGLARPVHRSEPFGLDRQLHSCHRSDHRSAARFTQLENFVMMRSQKKKENRQIRKRQIPVCGEQHRVL